VQVEAEAALCLSRCFRDRGDYQQGAATAAVAARVPGELGHEALYVFGICCERLGRNSEAASAFETLYAISPDEQVSRALTRMALRKGFEAHPVVSAKVQRLIGLLPGHSHDEKAESLGWITPLRNIDPRDGVRHLFAEVVDLGDSQETEEPITNLARLFFWANPDASLANTTFASFKAKPHLTLQTEDLEDPVNATVADLRKLTAIRLPSYNSSWMGN